MKKVNGNFIATESHSEALFLGHVNSIICMIFSAAQVNYTDLCITKYLKSYSKRQSKGQVGNEACKYVELKGFKYQSVDIGKDTVAFPYF